MKLLLVLLALIITIYFFRQGTSLFLERRRISGVIFAKGSIVLLGTFTVYVLYGRPGIQIQVAIAYWEAAGFSSWASYMAAKAYLDSRSRVALGGWLLMLLLSGFLVGYGVLILQGIIPVTG
ncbi:MAG: hypothetical protein PHW75_00870 [Patescibacteria group bacterium]|nr:hypothetical protein [Patescibacteria group bacterium]